MKKFGIFNVRKKVFLEFFNYILGVGSGIGFGLGREFCCGWVGFTK